MIPSLRRVLARSRGMSEGSPMLQRTRSGRARSGRARSGGTRSGGARAGGTRSGGESSRGWRSYGHWRERGSGTVLALAAIGVLLVVVTAGLQLGAAAAAAHRARTAADLAALAGASALQEGQPDACARAASVAGLNQAQVIACTLGENESVSIRVSTAVETRWPGVPDRAVASARAGPAEPPRP